MGTKALAIPRTKPGQPIEPFQHPAPKLTMAPPDMQPWKMTPPSMSPLHMTPPNMLLPNFSPIQDHMPLPTLSASKFCPPQSFLTHKLDQAPSVVKFSRYDPSVMVVGTSPDDPDEPRPIEQQSSLIIFKVEDVEREVRGDREMIARDVYEVRVKVRPRLTQMTVIPTPAGVLDLHFSPHDPAIMVATLATGAILFYRMQWGKYTAKPLSMHTLARGSPINSFAFSPTNRNLAAAAMGNGTCILIEIPSKIPTENDSLKFIATLQVAQASVLRCTFSVDGKRLYTAAEDGTIISWTTNKIPKIKERWRDDSVHKRGITELIPWPAHGNPDIGAKRRALLTGSYDHKFRVLDMSLGNRPPLCTQDMDLEGIVWRLAPLPPLPKVEEISKLNGGVFCPAQHPDVELDKEQVGVLAAAASGGGRVLIHKQKFEEVFLPRRDGSDIVNWVTSDGVLMDHEGREKKYYWYDLADIEEHGSAHVYACDAQAIIDYDPLFKDAGEQRKRRGWRLVSMDRDGVLCFWQVYVE